MAQVIPKFTFQNKGGRRSLYPWGEWTDGRIWRIKKGPDYTHATKSMRMALHNRAIHENKKVSTRVHGDVIEFQFRTKEAVTLVPSIPARKITKGV